MGRALQPAPAGIPAAFSYERRRPEETTLYQVVQEQLETFLAQVEAKTGAGLPAFVKDEFEAFLECGILADGFLGFEWLSRVGEFSSNTARLTASWAGDIVADSQKRRLNYLFATS